MDVAEDNVLLFQEAVQCLETAVSESQKTSNVDISLMLVNCQRCAQILDTLLLTENDPIRLGGLEQLSTILYHHQEVLSAKISQLDGQVAPPTPPIQVAEAGATNTQENKTSRQLAIEDTIVAKGQVTLEDVAGLQEAKQSLKEAIIIPLQFPHLFTGARKPWRRILLYGPPGTGKSRLAQAVSSEIQSTFYSVSSSDLVSSWVGESEKLIKELFSHATSQKGRSVIFIDEIDSICRQRSSREEEYTRRIKTELLKQMEGADNSHSADKIFLLCATNCPWELDSAFLRRFQKRIYIPLPDRDARIALMKIHTRDNEMHLREAEWATVADSTDGYSGSDLATLVMGALFEPIRHLQMATHWILHDGKWSPCSSDQPGAIKSDMTDLPPDQVQPRDVCLADFLESLSTHRNTVTKDELAKFHKFTQTFGQNG